jgi:hypothetical protein
MRDFGIMEQQYNIFLERWLEDEKSLPLQDVFIQVDNFINAFKVLLPFLFNSYSFCYFD